MAEQERAAGAVRRWLEGLKWDGKRRLRAGLPDALVWAPRSRKTEELIRWMAMAVRRALRPGCRAEKMLVLVGAPGLGKSAFFSALAGGSWWTDSSVALEKSRAGMEERQFAWVIECQDLGAASRLAREKRTALLALRTEIRRKPYSRSLEEVAAHWVLCGTSSAGLGPEYWGRWLAVCRVREAIDVEWVRQHREQLWAEVVARGSRP